MKKLQIKTKYDVDTFNVMFVLLIVFTVIFALFFKNIWLAALCGVGCLILRLLSGKLIVEPGDEIFVFGLPGSGKTMFLAKIAADNKKRHKYIFVNEELEHLKIKDSVIKREDLGLYRFGEDSRRSGVILYDECSLNGFDNRDYKTNFKGVSGEAILAGFKKSRHRYQGIVLSNQGWDELDKKVRCGLIKTAYWCKNKGWYSVAIRLRKDMKIDDITGEPMDMYIQPSIFDRIIDPRSYIFIPHKKYGKLYDTIHDSTPFVFDKPMVELSDEDVQGLFDSIGKE